jgi:hypothetical protein
MASSCALRATGGSNARLAFRRLLAVHPEYTAKIAIDEGFRSLREEVRRLAESRGLKVRRRKRRSP